MFNKSTLYGPYKGGETVTFSWSYKNISDTYYELVNDYFIVSCPSYSASPLISKRVSRHSLSSSENVSLSYTYKIPEARFKSESGLVIKVGVMYQGSYIALLNKTIKPIEQSIINPLNYRSSAYIIKDRSFMLNESEVEEYFLFDEYRDYVECDEYNRLLFGNLSFLYKYPLPFISSHDGKLKFIDKDSLFPNLAKDDDHYSYLPFIYKENEGRITIAFTNLYFDPLSLAVNVNGVGSKSDYLYVPKGKSKLLKDYEFIIEAERIGINQISFTHCLETSISPYFLGDCESADYCVIGGVKK